MSTDEIDLEAEIAAFDELRGEFFSSDPGPEVLTETDALEVLAQEVDSRPEAESITIYAWETKTVSERWKSSAAAQLVEHLLESFDDEGEYGPSDRPTELSEGDRAEVAAQARALVDFFASKAPVWQCEQTAECELSAEAVAAILERENL